MQLHNYALAFCPPPPGIEYVKEHKEFLARRIGWYPSVNAQAHITLLSFQAEEEWLGRLLAFMDPFCANRAPVNLHFDHFGIYPNGTFFLAPDPPSRTALIPIMKAIAARFPFCSVRSTDPHMTIARCLTTPELISTTTLFSGTKPSLAFQGEAISLRRLNNARGQYDIIANFPLRGNQPPLESYTEQGCLF